MSLAYFFVVQLAVGVVAEEAQRGYNTEQSQKIVMVGFVGEVDWREVVAGWGDS